MELKLLNDQGQSASTVAAPDTIFGRDFNEALVHQIVVAFQANARSGNRAQKGRDTVKHSTKKPWRQKGTGRARSGMTRSEEHTSELQSLMRISYAVFCLNKKNTKKKRPIY